MKAELWSAVSSLILAQGVEADPKPVPSPPPTVSPPINYRPSPPPPSPPQQWSIIGRPQPLRRNSWFTTDDYPAAAMRNEEEGTVVVMLDVTAAGRVGNCRVLSTSGSSSLDSATCRIFRARARFQPPRDRRGQAIASNHVDRVRWQLPDTTSIPFEPAIATVSAVLAGDRMVECERLDRPAEPEEPDDDEATLATEACGIAFSRRQPVEAAIGQGRSRVRVTIEIERDGQPRATGAAQQGRPIFAATASFQVATDGSLAECRARATVRPRDRRVPMFDLCMFLQRPTLYLFQEASEGRPQQGRLTITVRESEVAR